MTTFTLRPARETDFASIKELIHVGGINPMGLDWKRFVVAENAQGQVIGCGQIKPHGQEILELASIAVSPEHRGHGIARKIIGHLLSNSPRPLYLMCRSGLGALYERFGFRSLGYDEMPRYFQRISKLAGMVASLTRKGEFLLIMKLQ